MHIRYDASTPGGQLVATASAKLLGAIEDFRNLKGMVDQVGNMGGSFSAANFQAGNNTVFSVNNADCQAFNDQVAAIDAALSAMLADDDNESRLYSLYQAD